MNDYTPTHGWGPELHEFLPEGRYAWSEAYNASKHVDSFECCVVCGKRTTADKGIVVVMGAGGSTLLHPADALEAERNDNGFMGTWMVGPECGKRIPQEFRVKAQVA